MRHGWIPTLLAALVGAGASSCAPAPTASAPSPRCVAHLPSSPFAGAPEPAVLRDVAAGPSEYLVGFPGGRVGRLEAASGFSPPRVAGGDVFYSIREGQSAAIMRGRFGGCAYRLATGNLGDVEPRGRALTALVANHWVMLDRDGRQVARLTGAAGAWTPDGHLVEPIVGGVDIFDLNGHRRTVKAAGISPLGSLGSSQELVAGATGVEVMDLTTGALRPLPAPPGQVLRAASGSPDGSRVAYLDQQGSGQVLDLETGHAQPVPSPALATGFAWSHDSQWLALQTVYGGTAIRLADDRVVDSGSLVVVSW